jgi:ABC-type Na+ efflux pump permease subunit
MSTYLFAPLFLILPLMVSSVIAADSFAGEKERKTLEALLYTPTSDRELLLAKLLAAWMPAVAIALLSFGVYALLINLLSWPVMGRIFFPNTMWVVLVLWVAPATAAMGLGATVLVSGRVSTFQEAYQLGGFVVVPIVALMLSQVTGLLFLSVGLVIGLGLIFWCVALLLIWLGSRALRRDVLATRL